ncbi:xylulokinase [Allostreptomyces psammosilenae]|uniref:Xylulokinase n=1 Tax=Allostreptomyces psammosilenae TaxID=1892865 RepID=A0A853AA17_9ACTN|nr:FGGY family carbohydrate kinase [Allostreptomyces psammosilenae]NYI07222.1 xylulokinase [Allostreptomyces psammosilenae]
MSEHHEERRDGAGGTGTGGDGGAGSDGTGGGTAGGDGGRGRGGPPALLGIDLGTSGLKALLLAEDGTVLGEESAGYAVHAPAPGQAETDPEHWWAATRDAVGRLRRRLPHVRVRGLCVDGQMHGLVLTDAHGTPTRPAICWPDQRAGKDLAAWAALPEAARARLANPLTPGMYGPLLAWATRADAAAVHAARWALLPKDWLRHRLTDRAATDPSDASATLLWDVPADDWHTEAVEAAGVDPGLLPPVAASGARAGELTRRAAEALGLAPGLPVAVGAGDTPAALLGTGLGPDGAQLTVGSGAQLVRRLPRLPEPGTPPAPPRTHLYRTADPHGWYEMAALQNAGIALDWARRLLGASWEELYATADPRRRPPGAEGVVFLPQLTGERTGPGGARGTWTGMGLSTTRDHLLQAALEGVAYALLDVARDLRGGCPPSLLVAGGGTRDPRMRRLLADVLGATLHRVDTASASAAGAALLAADAAGLPRPPLDAVTGRAAAPEEPSHWRERRAAGHARYRRYRRLLEEAEPAPAPH